jgi:tetratricopeptide (TPR) repeat protein
VLAALGCKESAVLVPFAMLVPGANPSGARPWLPLAAAAAWFAAWAATGGPGLDASGLAGRLPAIAAATLEHVRLVAWPGDLHLERFVPVPGWSAGVTLAMWAGVLAAWTPLVVARNRDWRDEETLFRHTLRFDPPAARVWYNLGNVRLHAGDPIEAERLYREAAKRAPTDAAVRLNLGIALHRQGRREEAEEAYTEALRLDPSLARAFDRAR